MLRATTLGIALEVVIGPFEATGPHSLPVIDLRGNQRVQNLKADHLHHWLGRHRLSLLPTLLAQQGGPFPLDWPAGGA